MNLEVVFLAVVCFSRSFWSVPSMLAYGVGSVLAFALLSGGIGSLCVCVVLAFMVIDIKLSLSARTNNTFNMPRCKPRGILSSCPDLSTEIARCSVR